MSYEATVIAHSASPYPYAPALFTMRLRYPKLLHAEELTHRILNTSPEQVEIVSVPDGIMYDRDLSRNASSSRAIPVPRLIDDIRRDPAEPLFWGKHQRGMQAAEELTGRELELAKAIWRSNRESCIVDALQLHALGAHKQLVNRLVEKHGHINVVASATNWSNFFALRRHPGAMPEIQHLASLIWEAQQASTPKVLQPGEWHLPFVSEEEINERDWSDNPIPFQVKLSVARCARVSYLTHEGKPPDVEEDLALYERLVGSVPLHASPAEHAATPDRRINGQWEHPEQHGNLKGWRQYRKMLPNECS